MAAEVIKNTCDLLEYMLLWFIMFIFTILLDQ